MAALPEFLKCGPINQEIMSNQESIRKTTAVLIMTVLLATVIVVAENTVQLAHSIVVTKPTDTSTARGVPIATSANNLYMAWTNNDTGHYNVLFAKSSDGGKTLKTMMISAPDKGHSVDFNTQISASGSNVYVTWWTNKTGTLMPVFRASNDNGNTFSPIMKLNSTSGCILIRGCCVRCG
jgi:HJR/Mrr/RecB family endonuclease